MAESKAANKQIYLATGRRKKAVARVRVTEGGSGKIEINGRALENYFTEDKDRNAVLGPLLLTDMRNRLDVRIMTEGGGFTGQAGAICQGLARALKNMFGPADAKAAPAASTAEGQAADSGPIGMLKKLRDSGYLTRDGRMKERKKYGLKGARRAFQFSKR
jgi:small subunit ribosomal protein S9